MILNFNVSAVLKYTPETSYIAVWFHLGSYILVLTRVNFEHMSSASRTIPARSMYLAHLELM